MVFTFHSVALLQGDIDDSHGRPMVTGKPVNHRNSLPNQLIERFSLVGRGVLAFERPRDREWASGSVAVSFGSDRGQERV